MSAAVVLTGRGVVSPLGIGVAAHWEALAAGRGALGPSAAVQGLGLEASRGAAVADEALQAHLGRLPRKQQKLYNRATLLGMLAAALAAEEAGLPPAGGEAARRGVLLGVNTLAWDADAMRQYVTAAESRTEPGRLDLALANAFCMRHINPLDYSLKTLPNLAAGHLAIAHDAQGPCRALAEGPIAGTHAIGQAYRMLDDGDLDVAFCGGTDSPLDPFLYAGHAGLGLVAADTDGRAAVPGEGSGVAVLERAEHARARGAVVRGEVLGFATAAGDGRLRADPATLGRRLARVVEDAVAEAGDVPDVVSLHGDGRAAHEEAEAAALGAALGARAARTPRFSPKACHGALGAAGGAVELLACSALLAASRLPAAAAPPAPAGPLRRALVITLGVFGECAALVLGAPASGGAR